MKKKFLPVFVIVIAFFVFSAKANNVTIDMKFNVLGQDKNNSFNWILDGKVVKDGYDATTGASKSNTTYLFDSVRYESKTSKKTTIPTGLRCLVLFPLSDYETAEMDAFTVFQINKEIIIRFVHRGVAYEIKTDKNGKIRLDNSFYYAPKVAENIGGIFLIKEEYLIPGGNPANMADLDWEKITLINDVPSATKFYSGTLTASLKKGILSVKGRISM